METQGNYNQVRSQGLTDFLVAEQLWTIHKRILYTTTVNTTFFPWHWVKFISDKVLLEEIQ